MNNKPNIVTRRWLCLISRLAILQTAVFAFAVFASPSAAHGGLSDWEFHWNDAWGPMAHGVESSGPWETYVTAQLVGVPTNSYLSGYGSFTTTASGYILQKAWIDPMEIVGTDAWPVVRSSITVNRTPHLQYGQSNVMAEYGYNPLRNLHPGDPAERWIPVSAGNNVTFGVSFYAQRTSMIGHAIVQFVPNPSPPPPVPDIDPPSYFAGELDPSLVLSPLTVGADFELNVPGIDPIEYHASLPIGQDQLPVDIDPMQFGFATNEFVANLLRKFTPFSETVEVTGTVRLSGDAQLGGKLYLTEGSKTARLEAGIGAGVNLTVKARLQGSFCDVPLLGKMLCREVSATFPISGLTYGYSKDIPLPVIYDDESKEIDLAGMGISASLYAESSATLGAQVSLREVMPNAYPGMIFDMDIIESLDDPLNWTIEDYLNSETGTVEIPGPGNVTMETDSPVWIATMYEVTRSSDVIVFEAEFLSDLGAEGFLSVYWDDQLIGSLAEQDATARKQIYLFALPGVYDGGSYPLAFRLDPLSDIDSKVSISDVAAGFAAVPEPTTSFLLALGGLAMLRRRRRRGWL